MMMIGAIAKRKATAEEHGSGQQQISHGNTRKHTDDRRLHAETRTLAPLSAHIGVHLRSSAVSFCLRGVRSLVFPGDQIGNADSALDVCLALCVRTVDLA